MSSFCFKGIRLSKLGICKQRGIFNLVGCALVALATQTGCGLGTETSAAPVRSIAVSSVPRGVHKVVEGESLAKIADRYGRDFRELARINGIQRPYRIRVGQTIALSRLDRQEIEVDKTPQVNPSKPTLVATRWKPKMVQPKETQPVKKKKLVEQVKAVNKAPTAEKPKQTVANIEPKKELKTTTQHTPVPWMWPTEGKVISKFQDRSTNKGIEIANKLGTPIQAVKSGKVVYSGQGLRGYGRLLIIKHDDQYLSAYAHNHELLVKEGQHVQQGQTVATMGQTDTSQVKLHFELRYNGKPVDPLSYLSKDRG